MNVLKSRPHTRRAARPPFTHTEHCGTIFISRLPVSDSVIETNTIQAADGLLICFSRNPLTAEMGTGAVCDVCWDYMSARRNVSGVDAK